ncbi:MAG: hypothetical protein ACSHYA_05020 [Opitutaceae bacterium]
MALIAFLKKDQLPDYTEIDASLRLQPIQRAAASRPSFKINYKDNSYEVRPKASYKLRGLVVSKNSPIGFLDAYNNASSIYTKNLCVIWGQNIRNNDFQKASYRSGAWTCSCKWNDKESSFRVEDLSNNHLITNDQEIRDQIAKVGIGDQIHIKGMLVDYRELGIENSSWRTTSLTRNDTGKNAYEAILVDEFKILRSESLFWRDLFSIASIGLIVVLSCRGVLFINFGIKLMNRSSYHKSY